MANGNGERGREHSICAHGVEVRGATTREVPVGVERALYLAATDPSFRGALERDRDRALSERGIRLQPSERAVLGNVSDAALASMIDSIRVPDHRRRKFIKAVAAVSVGAAGLVYVEGCDMAEDGIRPQDDGAVDGATDADLPAADSTVDASVLDDASPSFGSRPMPLPEEDD